MNINEFEHQQIAIKVFKPEESAKVLLEKLKTYKFPQCTKEEIHDTLNIMCVDPHCSPDKQLEALCARCSDQNIHRKPTHLQMSIRNTLNELLKQCININDTSDLQEDTIEKEYKKTVKQYKSLSSQCLQIADNLEVSLNKYTKARTQSPEQNMVRKIISKILNSSNNERILRSNLKELGEYVLITERGLVLNDSISSSVRDQIIQSSKNYIDYHREVRKKVLLNSMEKLLGMGVIQDYDKLVRKYHAMGGNVNAQNVTKKDNTIKVNTKVNNQYPRLRKSTVGLPNIENQNQRMNTMYNSSSHKIKNNSSFNTSIQKQSKRNQIVQRNDLRSFENENPNIYNIHNNKSTDSPSKVWFYNNKNKLNSQNESITEIYVREIKEKALKYANQSGNHGTSENWWNSWEEMRSDNGQGWVEDNTHGPNNCEHCFVILQKAIKDIDNCYTGNYKYK